MTFFVQSILLLYTCLIIYSFIDSIQIRKTEKKEEKKRTLYQHPLLVEAGIKPPLEEIELEEVLAEELPLCWSVRYNERKDDHCTILLIEEKKLISQ